MSKLAQIQELIRGQHCFSNTDADGLRDYYRAREVRDTSRIKNLNIRFAKIKSILNPYSVTVRLEQESILLYRTNAPEDGIKL